MLPIRTSSPDGQRAAGRRSAWQRGHSQIPSGTSNVNDGERAIQIQEEPDSPPSFPPHTMLVSANAEPGASHFLRARTAVENMYDTPSYQHNKYKIDEMESLVRQLKRQLPRNREGEVVFPERVVVDGMWYSSLDTVIVPAKVLQAMLCREKGLAIALHQILARTQNGWQDPREHDAAMFVAGHRQRRLDHLAGTHAVDTHLARQRDDFNQLRIILGEYDAALLQFFAWHDARMAALSGSICRDIKAAIAKYFGSDAARPGSGEQGQRHWRARKQLLDDLTDLIRTRDAKYLAEEHTDRTERLWNAISSQLHWLRNPRNFHYMGRVSCQSIRPRLWDDFKSWDWDRWLQEFPQPVFSDEEGPESSD